MLIKNGLKWAAYVILAAGALCPLMTLVGAVGNQTGWLNFRTALGLFIYGGKAALPIVGIVLLIFAASVFMKVERTVKIAAISGLFLALTIYIPYYIFMDKVQTVPKIHDITTDTENPPAFVKVAAIRATGLNSLEYGGPKIAQQQVAAYPEVRPAYLNVDKAAAFLRVISVVKELGWEVVDTNQTEGRIEATDSTPVFGFKDDVVIRITAEGPQKSRIDIRSASRVGGSDVGVNAARIVKFLHKLQ